MEVLVRERCSHCNGTGKSGLSFPEALAEIAKLPRPGVVPVGEYPKSDEQRAEELMTCSHCNMGYVEYWADIDTLK